MEIGGMTSAYADYLTNTATDSKTSNLQNKLKSDYSEATDDELMNVCKEFESYFLEQVFDAMIETTKLFSEDEDSGDSYATKMVDYFKDSAVQELASQATDQNGFGIAQTLYEQMKRQYSAVDPAELEKKIENQ